MKNTIKFLALILFINLTALSFAHPPQSVTLTYDNTNTTLRTDINHLSRDNLSHYIEKIEIIKNEDSPIVKHFRQQINPNSFFYDHNINAEDGDRFFITVYSREGGTATTELEITKELLDLDVPERTPRSRSITTVPNDPNKIKSAVLTSSSELARPAVPNDPLIQKAAVTRSPEIAVPANPKTGQQLKNAVPNKSSSIMKPAVTSDPATAKPALP